MSWWEWFNTAAGAASLGSLILGAILGVVSWCLSRGTDRLIETMDARWRETWAGVDARTEQARASTAAILERMDQRADERHRETLQVIQALKG